MASEAQTTLKKLSTRLREYGQGKAMENDLQSFLTKNSEYILNLNKEQLFDDSIGADGVKLGYYSYNTAKFPGQEHKRGGDEFTMIASGDFHNRMFIKVARVNIIIGSKSPHTRAMLDNPKFLTNNFFGLTKPNEDRVARWLGLNLAKWVTKDIKETI